MSATILPDFVMKVVAGRAACAAHGSDALIDSDTLSGFDAGGCQVGISGFEAITVIDLDHIAIACADAHEGNNTGSG